jgi:N-sulfoglucosamine sulfohydrolase
MRTLTTLLALLTLTAATTTAVAADSPRRNVLLLVADDLGFELGCYGNDKIKTPNIDALAKNGTRFTHAFATVSSCSPSRACLYTGLYTHTSGQYGLAHAEHHFRTRETVQSLPAALKKAGYRTAILGKIHVEPQSVYPFDEEITKDIGGNRSVAVMAKKAQQFMTECGDKPFLLIVGYSDPHRSAKNFGNENTYPGVTETKFDPKDVLVPHFLPDAPDTRKDLAEYYQSVSRLDQGVGMMLDALKQTKNADNTLIIFLSDNGIPFPGAKTTLYDEGVHLPLLVASPEQKKHGVVSSGMVSWIDVTPTILDWTNAKGQLALPGRSILPILDEEKPKGWDVVFGSHQSHEVTMYYPMRMIRTRQYKYILNLAHPLEYPFAADVYNSPTWQGILKRGDKTLGERTVADFLHRPKEELYDLEKDPHETKNLAGDRQCAETLADLRQQLRQWQERTKDPWVVKYSHE